MADSVLSQLSSRATHSLKVYTQISLKNDLLVEDKFEWMDKLLAIVLPLIC